jgi:hypothetical protein
MCITHLPPPSMGEGDRVSGGRGWQVEIMRHTLSCTIPAAPPLVAVATTFAPVGSMSLDFRVAALPYSTAITDSLDSQVAAAPLRIQFAGVTPVPLPPPVQGHYGRWAFRSICAWSSSERKTIQPGLRPVEMHPFCRLRRRLPTEGEILAALCLVMLMG